MNVLRVRLDAAPASDRAEAWALFDAAGACVQKGRDRMAAWPAAGPDRGRARRDARCASRASRCRRCPQSRVAGAAAFALEDQLAGPNAAHHLAVSTQARDGRVRVVIVARPLIAEIVDGCPNVTRIIAECDLALPATDWRWCAREPDAAGFVRRPDGSAFPADAPRRMDALPAELALALAQARRSGVASRARPRGSANRR